MSFIQKKLLPFFSQKNLSSFAVFLLIISTIFIVIPPQKSEAFLGLPISFDPPDIAENTISAVVEDGIVAPATVINTANSTAMNVKVYLLDGLATAFARMAVQGITAQTVNWINSGFKGNPAYVTDPGRFFTNIGDQTVTSFLGTQGVMLNKLCTPFKPQLRMALVQSYINDTSGQVSQCSIQQIVKNYDAFTQDFTQGGWEGWFSMTQTMSNNPYGAYLEGQDVLSRAVAGRVNKYQNQLNQGRGFLSFEKCTQRVGAVAPAAGGTSTQGTKKVTCVKYAPLVAGDPKSGTCLEEKEVTLDSNGNEINTEDLGPGAEGACLKTETLTPGSVISDQLRSVLGSAVDELNVTNSINQLVSALMVQGFKAVVGGISNGLRGLSQPQSGGTNTNSITTQMSLQTDTTKPEGQAAAQETYSSIKQYIEPGSSVSASINPTDPGPTTPQIDRNTIKSEVEGEINAYGALITPATTGGTTGTGGGGTTPVYCTDAAGFQVPANPDGTCPAP